MFAKKIFAERLLEIRKATHTTQANIAAALGVSTAFISDMENGRKTTSIEKLAQICAFYNISADYLLGLTNEMRPPVHNQKEDAS